MSLADEPPLRDLADRIVRQSLLHPDNLRSFLGRAVPNLAAGFDCTRARLLDRECPVEDWRRREADLPFEIPYRMGAEEIWALVYVLLEHQSHTDPLMPLRMLYFAVAYWEQQWKAWEQSPRPRKALKLRPVLPIVFHTGSGSWGSNRTIVDMLGEPAAFHAFAPAWQPLFWNLAEQTPESLLHTGEEWLQALAVVRPENADAADFAAVLEQVVSKLQTLHGRDQVRWYDLLRIVLTWVMWRRPQPEHAGLVAAAIEAMSEKLGATLADIAIAKGRVLGKQEGLLEGNRENLRALLEDRFGPLPQDLVQQIDAFEDVERLKKAIRQVSRLEKLQDLSL